MFEKGNKSEEHLNRRNFLKGVAATGAISGIAAAHSVYAEQSSNQNKSAAKSWRDKPDPIDNSLISDGGTCDVVVEGDGNSGPYPPTSGWLSNLILRNKGSSYQINQIRQG